MKKTNNNKSIGINRRDFVKKSALASKIFIVPRHVLEEPGFLAPSDRLNIAAIGAGGKGISDIKNASVNGRERVAALCDVDFSGSAAKSIENFPKAKLFDVEVPISLADMLSELREQGVEYDSDNMPSKERIIEVYEKVCKQS